MPAPRLDPARVMTSTERARRTREARAAYIAALERAVRDAANNMLFDGWWHTDHAATIARARAGRTEKKD